MKPLGMVPPLPPPNATVCVDGSAQLVVGRRAIRRQPAAVWRRLHRHALNVPTTAAEPMLDTRADANATDDENVARRRKERGIFFEWVLPRLFGAPDIPHPAVCEQGCRRPSQLRQWWRKQTARLRPSEGSESVAEAVLRPLRTPTPEDRQRVEAFRQCGCRARQRNDYTCLVVSAHQANERLIPTTDLSGQLKRYTYYVVDLSHTPAND